MNTKSDYQVQYKKIKKLAKCINQLASQAIYIYSPEVNSIIISGCMDNCRIERVLDGMLDFCFDDNMLELYKKLCRYYYNINPVVTAEYVFAYREMWD